jgi:hypothetical protein
MHVDATRREVAATAVGFGLLAVALTWPLALTLTSRYPGNRPLDIWTHAWDLWWMRHALTALGTNPFETRFIFYPDGVPLYLHSFTPLAGLLALPAGLLWGTLVSYNLTVLAALALAGLATFWLARRWVGPAGAALGRTGRGGAGGAGLRRRPVGAAPVAYRPSRPDERRLAGAGAAAAAAGDRHAPLA